MNEILRAARLFFRKPGDVVELRAVGVKDTRTYHDPAAGYFDNAEDLARAASMLTGAWNGSGVELETASISGSLNKSLWSL